MGRSHAAMEFMVILEEKGTSGGGRLSRTKVLTLPWIPDPNQSDPNQHPRTTRRGSKGQTGRTLGHCCFEADSPFILIR